MVQKVPGSCAVPSGTEAGEPLQARKERHERAWTNIEHHLQAGKKEKCQTEMPKDGKLKEAREESQGMNASG